MKKELINKLHKDFEGSAKEQAGVEYWTARDLQQLLSYSKWDNFLKVIEKAKEACKNSKIKVQHHFAEVGKMVEIGSSTKREISDYQLTRYACYLIAQNGDPRKDEIAFAQTYFAVQTRKQEIIEDRLKELKRIHAREQLVEAEKRLAGVVFERGVDSKGFARIKSKGDEVLFGGNSTRKMKSKLKVPEKRPLADFLPRVTLTAKTLADEMTEHNVLERNLRGEPNIDSEHQYSNKAVRKALTDRGIKPEELPPAEDIKKLQQRVKAEGKKLPKQTKTLTK
jgi:DNA-damage-inducible protein D